ncbi:MAG: hypothetical protein JRH11_04630 [Deltaproteobacteria bacterium]|nr:hypothetical protein [Deltaproteobacteria bacterium]
MSAPADQNTQVSSGAGGPEEPSPNGTRLVLGLLAAVLLIAAISTWAVIADRRARPRPPPQTHEDAGLIVDDGPPTPPADDGVGNVTH